MARISVELRLISFFFWRDIGLDLHWWYGRHGMEFRDAFYGVQGQQGFKAWCMEMGCYDTNGTGWERGIFADDGKSLLG